MLQRMSSVVAVCLSVACFGCPGGDETGTVCTFGTRIPDDIVDVCYEAKGSSEDQCEAAQTDPGVGSPTWDAYDSCEKARQGDGTWRQCPGKKNLWVDGVFGGAEAADYADRCSAAADALGLDGTSGGGDDGTGGGSTGTGMGMSTLDWGPDCYADPASGWFCVDCEVESMDSPPFDLGTEDIQVWSECATACTRWDQSFGEQYDNPTDQQTFKEAVEGSCGILGQFDANNANNGITSNYRASCQYCP
jgi:hypothetical protein